MELFIAFFIFAAFMTVSLLAEISMLWPLCAGFVLFSALAVRRGYSVKAVLGFAAESLKESFIVIGILLLIGCLTGLWRLSGTVAYFITMGVSVIPPRLFLPSAFLLASAMSFALGTSFGVTATAGVILMSVARAGGVDPILAAGAILSGVYLGDRGSPAASSANLVAVMTHTDMRKNVRLMLKCSLVPFALCCLLFTLLSLKAPVIRIDSDILSMLSREFASHWLCIVPAVLMIVLPFCGLRIKLTMAVSLITSGIAALTVQHCGLMDCFKVMVLGYEAKNPLLSDMVSGGGIVSMLEVCGILLVSCSYGTIFEKTGILENVNRKVAELSGKLGRFPVMLLLSFGVSMVFCNQTVSTIMQSDLATEMYGDSDGEKTRKMLDMENSVILIPAMVPWCLSSFVPRTMLNVSAATIPVTFYIWLVPLWWLICTAGKKK